MEVNDQLVDKIANLARLQFRDTEKASIKEDLQRMILFVEKLNEFEFKINVDDSKKMNVPVTIYADDNLILKMSEDRTLDKLSMFQHSLV